MSVMLDHILGGGGELPPDDPYSAWPGLKRLRPSGQNMQQPSQFDIFQNVLPLRPQGTEDKWVIFDAFTPP